MNKISSCDENRLRIAEQAQKSFDLARKLAADGKFEQALEHYLYAFDNSRYVDGWGGVRTSYIPSEITTLGAKFPPALDALRERRDTREELIRAGKADYDIVTEWLSINGYLGDNDRMLAMLDEVDAELRAQIIDSNFEQLLANKQYKLAGRVLDDRGHMFFTWEFHYETEKYFPSKMRNPEKILECHLQATRQSALEVFELALAVKRIAPAREVARRLLLHCGDADTYIALLAIAKRVGSKTISSQLLKQAKSQLAPEDFARVGTET